MARLVEHLVVRCDLPSLLNLRLACSSFRGYLDSLDLLSTLLGSYLPFVHSDTEDRPILFALSGELISLPSLVRLLNRHYFTPWTKLAIGNEQACIRAASYNFLPQLVVLYEEGGKVLRTAALALCPAAKYGYVEVVVYLVECIGDYFPDNLLKPIHTAFLNACTHERAEVMKVMLEKGVYDYEDGVNDYIDVITTNDDVDAYFTLATYGQVDEGVMMIQAGRQHAVNIINRYFVGGSIEKENAELIFEGAVEGGHADLMDKCEAGFRNGK